MAATMREVAEAAGVSVSSVSRVFAAPHTVGGVTRDKVMAVARDMNYRPNQVARSLATGQTKSLALIVPDVANPFFAALVKSVQNRAHHRGRIVVIGDTDEQPRDEYELATALATRVDGLLLVSSHMSAEQLGEVLSAVPTVLLNSEPGESPSVLATSSDGMRQAVEHLYALGHRSCAYVNGPPQSWSNGHRRTALVEACQRLHMDLVEFGPYQPKFASGVASADLVQASGVTAVIAHNDMIALGLLSRFAQQGVAVPGDISVIGVDDTPLAATTIPPLTTVRVPLGEMGIRAVDLLLDVLDAPKIKQPIIYLPASLTVRGSTGRVSIENRYHLQDAVMS